jgi:hypothetical protein
MKPYEERSDLERLNDNWRKFNKLMEREDWSAAVTRAATAAEIAANIAIRSELQEQRQLEVDFVNHLLIWANGLAGKLDKLLRPLHSTDERREVFNTLNEKAKRINKQRNLVVHSGNFMNVEEAEEIKLLAKDFIEGLVGIYHQDFELRTYTDTDEDS